MLRRHCLAVHSSSQLQQPAWLSLWGQFERRYTTGWLDVASRSVRRPDRSARHVRCTIRWYIRLSYTAVADNDKIRCKWARQNVNKGAFEKIVVLRKLGGRKGRCKRDILRAAVRSRHGGQRRPCRPTTDDKWWRWWHRKRPTSSVSGVHQ